MATEILIISSSPILKPANMPDTPARGPPPPFHLTIPPHLSSYDKSPQQWLVDNSKTWSGLAVGTHVFNPDGRQLLVQRAAHDSSPNKWEVPGGAADPGDATLFHAAARELWEEAGLVVTRVRRAVTEGQGRGEGSLFANRKGTRFYCRFSFEVAVEAWEGVSLDPNEHQDFVWATEEEVRRGVVGERRIEVSNFQMKRLILEAFRLRREEAEEDEVGEE
jgi:8-oxo-dGTP pyrophosphatase MutT (NUDIX family)